MRTLVFLGSAAIGLLAATWLLDDVSVSSSGFIFAVVLFAVIQSVLAPFFARFAARNAAAFLGGIGLVSTFVALLATTIIGDSLRIEGGAVPWISATVIVWLVTAAATLFLPILLVKAGVRSAQSRSMPQ